MKKMTLVNKMTSSVVKVGDKVKTDSSGPTPVETYVVVEWEEPRHINSSGRVFVKRLRAKDQTVQGYFPHVFGMQFIDMTAGEDPARDLAEHEAAKHTALPTVLPTMELDEVIRRLLDYSLTPIGYDWECLTDAEKKLVTKAQLAKLKKWMGR